MDPKQTGYSGSHVALGFFVGLLQLGAMIFVVSFASQGIVVSSYLNSNYGFIIALLIGYAPLIAEIIFLRKTYPSFVKGALIGSVLIPLIGLGLCFLILSGSRL